MTGYTPIYNLPYPQASDLVSAYPGTGQDLAEEVETVLAAKAAKVGAVIQVVSTNKADTFTTTSTTLTDVTGLSAAITPSSASNKVLVIVSLALQNATGAGVSRAALIRGTTQIGGGTAVGSRPSASMRVSFESNGRGTGPGIIMFLDSPATTTSTTYKIQIAAETATTAQVNTSAGLDNDNANYPRLSSTITLMEVGA